jgi:hypothetical protein
LRLEPRAPLWHPRWASGSVTVIQRFGGGLNLNVHFHTLLLDGVFFEGQDGALEFRPLPPPTDDEVGRVLARIAARVQRLLASFQRLPDETPMGLRRGGDGDSGDGRVGKDITDGGRVPCTRELLGQFVERFGAGVAHGG